MGSSLLRLYEESRKSRYRILCCIGDISCCPHMTVPGKVFKDLLRVVRILRALGGSEQGNGGTNSNPFLS